LRVGRNILDLWEKEVVNKYNHDKKLEELDSGCIAIGFFITNGLTLNEAYSLMIDTIAYGVQLRGCIDSAYLDQPINDNGTWKPRTEL